MQNHRLYNTKKDYVLDYLDRHNTPNNPNGAGSNPNQIYMCSSTTTSSSSSASCINEKGNILYTTANPETASNSNKQDTGSSQTTSNLVSRYERFPYLKSRERTNVDKKFAPSSSSNFKRTQSNSCIQARQSQNLVNLPVTTTPRSMFSASVDRLNAVNVIIWNRRIF